MQKLPDSYLYRQHSKNIVADWARKLQYFYFLRAYGGHANDDDTFQAGIHYSDRSDLEAKLAQLEIRPGRIISDDPQPEPGKSYRGDEFAKFKVRVNKFPDMEQPGLTAIAGQNVFVRILDNFINFSVSGTKDGNQYEVSHADFIACIKIETVFDQLDWRDYKYTSFEQSICCVSPHHYPELFKD